MGSASQIPHAALILVFSRTSSELHLRIRPPVRSKRITKLRPSYLIAFTPKGSRPTSRTAGGQCEGNPGACVPKRRTGLLSLVEEKRAEYCPFPRVPLNGLRQEGHEDQGRFELGCNSELVNWRTRKRILRAKTWQPCGDLFCLCCLELTVLQRRCLTWGST